MFRPKTCRPIFALAILSILPGIASASTITVSGSSFTDTIPLPGVITTFHLGATENASHGYIVDTTIDYYGGWGTMTFDAQNFSGQALTFALNLTLPLDPLLYSEAYTSITGNGTSSTSSFGVSVAPPAANVLVLEAGNPAADLGVDVGAACTVPSGISSFLCSTSSADAVFAPQFYDTLYGTLAFSMGGSNSFDYQANQLAWDAYFEVDPVPEPVNLSLIGVGLLALAMRRRRA
jgi:hypothetical protein